MDLALYAASAFAREKCICSYISLQLPGQYIVTNEKQIVLYQIMLEVLQRQGAISHLLHKHVLRKLFPGPLNIFALEDVFDKTVSPLRQSLNLRAFGFPLTV